jgi:FkbM family methyltransferase
MAMTIRRGPASGMKWIAGSSTHGCWLGTYELDKQKALARIVRPGMTVFDIGAQAGFYTLFFSRLVGGSGKVYAFEPFAENVQSLLGHIRINALRNVQVIQVALAACSGLAGFTLDRGNCQNALTDTRAATLVMPTLSLDEAVERYGLAPPALIKMDVEGAEGALLQGARRTLECYRPTIFVALHGEEQKQACQTLLESLRYRLYALDDTPVCGACQPDEVYALAPQGTTPGGHMNDLQQPKASSGK